MKFRTFLLQISGIFSVGVILTLGLECSLNGNQNPICGPIDQNEVKGCPGVTFTFPSLNQTTDYVRYRSYVPAMKEITVCAWIEAIVDFNRWEPVLSYASDRNANEFLFSFYENIRVVLITGSVENYINISLPTGKTKFHICTWVSSNLGRAEIYINGDLQTAVSDEFNDLKGGGDLILGQDQDSRDAGDLHRLQAFRGNITNLMVWPRVLTASEVGKIAHSCDCPRDYSVAMTMDRSELHGNVTYHLPSSCPTV